MPATTAVGGGALRGEAAPAAPAAGAKPVSVTAVRLRPPAPCSRPPPGSRGMWRGEKGSGEGGPEVLANGAEICKPSVPCNHLKQRCAKQLPGRRGARFLFPACFPPDFNFILFFF